MTTASPNLDWMLRMRRPKLVRGIPAHTQIERWLSDLVTRGEVVPGDRLPPEDRLATALGVSRMTLRQALAALEGSGVVARRSGRGGGTFIVEPRVVCDLSGLAGFTEQMRRAKLRAGARLVSGRTIPASAAVAGALGIDRGDAVHEVIRVRTVRREPFALERSYFPESLFPDLLSHRLSGSIYDLLSRVYGQKPFKANEDLEPVVAQADEAKHLEIAPGTPLMLIKRTASTAAGVPVEYAKDLFRPDKVRISLSAGIGPAGAAVESVIAIG